MDVLLKDDGIESGGGFIGLNTHFWDETKLYMAYANITNFSLTKIVD